MYFKDINSFRKKCKRLSEGNVHICATELIHYQGLCHKPFDLEEEEKRMYFSQEKVGLQKVCSVSKVLICKIGIHPRHALGTEALGKLRKISEISGMSSRCTVQERKVLVREGWIREDFQNHRNVAYCDQHSGAPWGWLQFCKGWGLQNHRILVIE